MNEAKSKKGPESDHNLTEGFRECLEVGSTARLDVAAPDGGWGWLVCFSCFLMNVLNGGVGYSFGVVFPELLDHFRGSQSETAWIFSLALFMSLILGPVFAALTTRFGCRRVAAAGSVISFVSYLASAVSPSLHFLYFSMGILAGIGDGAVGLSTIVCINQYFDKHRAFATGITVSGVGVGTFIFNPLTTLLIETYAWRGAVLLQSGLILNCLVCSLLYRPLTQKQRTHNRQHNHTMDSEVANNLESGEKQFTKISDDKDDDDDDDDGNDNDRKDIVESTILLDEFDDQHRVNHEISRLSRVDQPEIKKLNLIRKLHMQYGEEMKNETIDTVDELYEERAENIEDGIINATDDDVAGMDDVRPCQVKNIGGHEHLDVSSKRSKQNRTENALLHIVVKNIKDSFNLDLLKQKPFSLFVIATFISNVGYYIPYVYLPVMSSNAGVSASEAAWILSTLGICSTAARLMFGFLSDRRWMNRLYLFSTSLLICGVVSCLTSAMASFYGLMTYAAVFGTFSGATITLESVMTCDLVGKDNLSPAYGIIYLVAGIGSLFGAPLAGWLYELSGTYSSTFLLAGITFIVAALTMFTIACIHKH